jgi:hypothetical protein
LAERAAEYARLRADNDRILAEMERKPARAILPLLRARVTNIREGGFTLTFGPEYGSPTSISVVVDTRGYDLREGDLHTIYTECLLKQQGES